MRTLAAYYTRRMAAVQLRAIDALVVDPAFSGCMDHYFGIGASFLSLNIVRLDEVTKRAPFR